MTSPDDKLDPSKVIPYFRVVPRESALLHNSEVLPSEVVSNLIDQANEDEMAVTECICRKSARIHGKNCSAPVEDQCLFFGGFAVSVVENRRRTPLTREEAGNKYHVGLGPWTGQSRPSANDHPLVFCSCCTCCCAALKSLNT
jgi:hypothetical protein